ncbi:hypothetical protein [Dolichospermum sp. UHCC 0259]|uniref:hypothetical protein n=1 Tax=Dolichospermum sp. UHCC 0259 TaxID=2590010 RepID=UPI00144545AD|nr:hypothetical protein [Dolichospermum sp. UHCC 0259]
MDVSTVNLRDSYGVLRYRLNNHFLDFVRGDPKVSVAIANTTNNTYHIFKQRQ